MRLLIRSQFEKSTSIAEIPPGCRLVRLGSSADANDILLASRKIPSTALAFNRRGQEWYVKVAGPVDECRIDGTRLEEGQAVAIAIGSRIDVAPFSIEIGDAPGNQRQLTTRAQLDTRMAEFTTRIHVDLLARMDIDAQEDDRRSNLTYILELEHHIEDLARRMGLNEPLNDRSLLELADHIAGVAVRQTLCQRLIERDSGANRRASPRELLTHEKEPWRQLISHVPDLEQDFERLSDTLEDQLRFVDLGDDLSASFTRLETDFWTCWHNVSYELLDHFRVYIALREIKKQLKDIVFGYGPIEDLLQLPTVSDIMVVSKDRIYVERNGVLENSGRRFVSDEVTESIIERIVGLAGRRIDTSQPLADARLADGSRVNAIIAPLAVSGPCLTIRKFPAEHFTMSELIQKESISLTAAKFLQAAVAARRNIIVTGGTGSGKTTLLNCLSEFIPDKERVVTIEDVAELQLSKQHVVRLETKQKNLEGKGSFTIRDLVKNSLRMRPDRIVVGECRAGEALDMLQAMNTGHDGSLTTLHANSPDDAILRLEVLVTMAAPLPIDSIRRQIAAAVDLVVQTRRLRSGHRCVTRITEFVDFDPHSGTVRTKDIFGRDDDDAKDGLLPTGRLPSFMPRLLSDKLLDLSTFY